MASEFPYTRYVCPCTDITASPPFAGNLTEAAPSNEPEADEQTLNPSSPRANYALYPLENLLFCNECHELRCPRCYYEEALHYYCPSCLFETQSSVVKGETNRCTRSCFQCPVCIAPLSLSPYPNPADEPLPTQEANSAREGACILSCQWCSWTSLEIDIVFDKPVNISGQLAKLKNGAFVPDAQRDAPLAGDENGSRPSDASVFNSSTRAQKPTDQFSQLAAFYKNQISETNPSGPFGLNHNFGLDSPSQISRLLTTYGVAGLKKQKDKIPLMREALDSSEGLRAESQDDDDEAIIAKMRELGWEGTVSTEQRKNQANGARFYSDLRPISTPLRSRRAKRCRTCRHNLVKPDEKRQRFRYQIKLVALNFIPNIALRPLDHTTDLKSLAPFKTIQLLLTFHNPIFDLIKVTLATSPTTPGRITSKVTILCPQFEIGANTDVWDDALDTASVERRKARDALEGVQAEAGKIWEKGRNWTSIILEIVPGNPNPSVEASKPSETEDTEAEEEDADRDLVLEIPVFVRLEYETSDDASGETMGEEGQGKAGKEKKVKRELAYWCVLGAGRIAGLTA